MTLDRLDKYPPPWAAGQALAPKPDFGVETLRKWIGQAQVDAGVRVRPISTELEEIKKLKRENRDLRQINEILKATASFFASPDRSRVVT